MLKSSQAMLLECVKRKDLKLTKFISNTIKVLNTIPEEGQHRKIKNQDLEMSDRPVEKALGIHWNTENDWFLNLSLGQEYSPPSFQFIIHWT